MNNIHEPKTKKQLKAVNIQIPEGANVGDSLTFAMNGVENEVTIPDGSKPGDVLRIQIETVDDQQGENDFEDTSDTQTMNRMNSGRSRIEDKFKSYDQPICTKVSLGDPMGITLEIYNSIPNHDQRQTKKEPTSHVEEMKQNNANLGDGTNAMVWPAGEYTSKYLTLSSLQEDIAMHEKYNIVELGAGTGLVGLAYGAIISSRSSKRKGDVKKIKITLTDFPSAISLLEYNIEANRKNLSSSLSEGENISSVPLVWGSDISDDDLTRNRVKDADLILGSDLLYNVKSNALKDLCKTIKNIDSVKKATILLTVRWRKPLEEREFFQTMETMGYVFKLVCVEEKPSGDGDIDNIISYHCTLHWTEFGNPECQKSNEYFSNTHIQVNGVSKALKDVIESDMNQMSDDEYYRFETKFIQIYKGNLK